MMSGDPMARCRFTPIFSLPVLFGCAMSAPDPALPAKPTQSLGMAFRPGPCVAGTNVVPVSLFVSGAGSKLRYLEPTDGNLRFTLAFADGSGVPISVRWLEVSGVPDLTQLPRWNLELAFQSAVSGACPLRVEFDPSPKAESAGLGAARTTVLLTETPPLPPPPPLR